jgi:hypothetical protein
MNAGGHEAWSIQYISARKSDQAGSFHGIEGWRFMGRQVKWLA